MVTEALESGIELLGRMEDCFSQLVRGYSDRGREEQVEKLAARGTGQRCRGGPA